MMARASVLCLSLLACLHECLAAKRSRDPRSACDSGPCLNGGQCIDVSYPGGPKSFRCACKEGFEGITCQKHVDLCATDPCLNDGVCSQRGRHYHCACTEKFKGKNCELPATKKTLCDAKPCGVHGVCEIVNEQVVCECIPGFHGARCELSDMETNVLALPAAKKEKGSFLVENLLISVLFFVILFAVILLFTCCHCYRVWNKRSHLKSIQEAKKAAGKDPGPKVGWLEISNQLCYEILCCCWPAKSTEKEDMAKRVLSDPDNITGVIVPVKDYNALFRGASGQHSPSMPIRSQPYSTTNLLDTPAPYSEGIVSGRPIGYSQTNISGGIPIPPPENIDLGRLPSFSKATLEGVPVTYNEEPAPARYENFVSESGQVLQSTSQMKQPDFSSVQQPTLNNAAYIPPEDAPRQSVAWADSTVPQTYVQAVENQGYMEPCRTVDMYNSQVMKGIRQKQCRRPMVERVCSRASQYHMLGLQQPQVGCRRLSTNPVCSRTLQSFSAPPRIPMCLDGNSRPIQYGVPYGNECYSCNMSQQTSPTICRPIAAEEMTPMCGCAPGHGDMASIPSNSVTNASNRAAFHAPMTPQSNGTFYNGTAPMPNNMLNQDKLAPPFSGTNPEEEMAPVSNNAQADIVPQNYDENCMLPGSKSDAKYYDNRVPCVPNNNCNSLTPRNTACRKMTRSDLHAQHGKNFTQMQNPSHLRNALSVPGDTNFVYPSVMNPQCSPFSNTQSYRITAQEGLSQEPPRSEPSGYNQYPNLQTPCYPCSSQPNMCPRSDNSYPPQINLGDLSNSSSGPCMKHVISRGIVQRRENRERSHGSRHSALGDRPPFKLRHSAHTNPISKGQIIEQSYCEDSKMDNLQFADEDAEHAGGVHMLNSEDERGSVYDDTEEDIFDERGVDDDGYGSTSRLSESDAGGRSRDAQSIYEYKIHGPCRQQERLARRNKRSPRHSYNSNIQVSNAEYAGPETSQGSEDSSSEDEERGGRYCERSHLHPGTHQNPGERTRYSYRIQQQPEDVGHSQSKGIKRGDLWREARRHSLTPQRRLIRNEESSFTKSAPRLDGQSSSNFPKKVKGILKNSGQNCNRSASSYIIRRANEMNTNRSNNRRRLIKYRVVHEESD